MRATQRTFWKKSQYDSAKCVSEYMSASQAFSFLKFYQHVFSFFAKLPCPFATTRQRIINIQKNHDLSPSGRVWA